VGDDLGVGFRDEFVPFALQLILEVQVVLDDAVMDHDDSARAIAVRVRVFLGRPAVGRPARVSDPVIPFDRVYGDDFLEPRKLAGAAPKLD
jgi:hypothetical protein